MDEKKREPVSWLQIMVMFILGLFALYGIQHMAHHSSFTEVPHDEGCVQSHDYIVHHSSKVYIWKCAEVHEDSIKD